MFRVFAVEWAAMGTKNWSTRRLVEIQMNTVNIDVILFPDIGDLGRCFD
jgi:hypothetical protein